MALIRWIKVLGRIMWKGNIHKDNSWWKTYILKRYSESSGQDGGIGRNPLLPHTTKRRITTNPKTINNHKCQNIKLHGTTTTKELKKKSTRTRPVGRWMERNRGRPRTQEELSEKPRRGSWPCGRGWLPQGSQDWLSRKLRLSSLWNTVAAVEETPSLTWEFRVGWKVC